MGNTDELTDDDYISCEVNQPIVSQPQPQHQRGSTVSHIENEDPSEHSDESFNTIKEVVVEETLTEMDESEYYQRTSGPNTNQSYIKPVQVRTEASPKYYKSRQMDFENQVLQSSKNRRQNMATLEEAMNFKYTPKQIHSGANSVQKPKHYPITYNNPCEVAEIIDKIRSKSKDRKGSAGLFNFETMMRKSGSTEAIISTSLKQRLAENGLRGRSDSHQRNNSSQKPYKMIEFHSEVSKFRLKFNRY